jgi:hypothetical protein
LNAKITAFTRPAINEEFVFRGAEVNVAYLVFAHATWVFWIIPTRRRLHQFIPKFLPEALRFSVCTRIFSWLSKVEGTAICPWQQTEQVVYDALGRAVEKATGSACVSFTGQNQDTESSIAGGAGGLYDFLYREHSPGFVAAKPAGSGENRSCVPY